MALIGDLQYQVTQLYNRLTVIDSNLSQLALNSRITTVQDALSADLLDIANQINISQEDIREIQLTLSDVIQELRALA